MNGEVMAIQIRVRKGHLDLTNPIVEMDGIQEEHTVRLGPSGEQLFVFADGTFIVVSAWTIE